MIVVVIIVLGMVSGRTHWWLIIIAPARLLFKSLAWLSIIVVSLATVAHVAHRWWWKLLLNLESAARFLVSLTRGTSEVIVAVGMVTTLATLLHLLGGSHRRLLLHL